MPLDRFFIGFTGEDSGYQTNVKPWLINDEAFSLLENAYVFRGRVRKRFGSALMGGNQLNSRLRIEVGTTDGSGDASITVPGSEFNVGQMFSIGSELFTVYQAGTPVATLSTGSGSATYNTTTGAFVVTGAAATTDIYFYPATPVMGIAQYNLPSTPGFVSLAFDTQFSYQFDDTTGAWLRLSSGQSVWTGTDSDFFWSVNYQGVTSNLNSLFVTNYVAADGIRYWNNSTWTKPVINYSIGSIVDTTDGSGNASGSLVGTFFIGQVFNIGKTSFLVTVANGALTPLAATGTTATGTGTFNTATGAYTFTGAFANTSIYFTGNNFIATSRLIVSMRGRLLLFGTIENENGTNVSYETRLRYSAIGNPLTPNAFMSDSPGQGGFIDAPTTQAIVTAQFIKDRLIVYFESSTYELAYTGNQVLPFVWQKINTELGAESTFSQVPFDKVVLGIGNVGVHACNGNNVDRIDAKIPQLAFRFQNLEEGPKRVVGIRDYQTEMVYWSYPSQVRSDSFYFPEKVLVYNYVNNSWGVNDDSFTSFGYFLLTGTNDSDVTWGNTLDAWENIADLWNSNADGSTNQKVLTIMAGNQEGFMSLIQPNKLSNAAALQVTNFTIGSDVGTATISCINHNLSGNDFVLLTNMNGLTFTDSLGNVLPSLMGRVTPDPYFANTPNQFSIVALDTLGQAITITGTYTGGGGIARVSDINIYTKQYNFYTEQDRNIYVPKVDFLVSKTDVGQITVDFLIGSSPISISDMAGPSGTDALLGDNVLVTSPYALVPSEQFQERLWHPLYFAAEGECVQLRFFMTNNQMYNYTLRNGLITYSALQDFELHAMTFYAHPTSNRMQ